MLHKNLVELRKALSKTALPAILVTIYKVLSNRQSVHAILTLKGL